VPVQVIDQHDERPVLGGGEFRDPLQGKAQ
jgi:hypothetical protein